MTRAIRVWPAEYRTLHPRAKARRETWASPRPRRQKAAPTASLCNERESFRATVQFNGDTKPPPRLWQTRNERHQNGSLEKSALARLRAGSRKQIFARCKVFIKGMKFVTQ